MKQFIEGYTDYLSILNNFTKLQNKISQDQFMEYISYEEAQNLKRILLDVIKELKKVHSKIADLEKYNK